MKKYVLPFFLCAGALLISGCEKSRNTPGLSQYNICFGQVGGNVSQMLSADNDWYIFIPAENDWLSVSPVRGTASEQLIDLQFVATFNSNTDCRSGSFYVMIGDTQFYYTVNQDGSIGKCCIF